MTRYIQIREEDEVFEKEIEGIKFRLRRISTDKYDELKRHRTKVKFSHGQRYFDTNENELNKDLLDAMIESWPDGAVRNSKGEVFPCDRKTKALLPFSIIEKVIEACDAYSIESDTREQEVKN